ncbi:phage minor tail protein L [Escherichia coli]|uniref:phage minor tail protein L n=1 Tax=Escherichia coli TaxID=562 RepID=UPI00351B5546
MQDIREESLNESVKSEQSPRVVLWEIDLTVQGGERYFFCNELNEKGEPVTWQGRKYEAYPIDGSGFEMNDRGSSARPSLTVSNLFGLVTAVVSYQAYEFSAVCRSDKALTPHPTITALPDATLLCLIRPTSSVLCVGRIRRKLNLVFYVVNIDLNDLLTHKTKLNQNKILTTRIHSDKNIMVN